MLKTLKNVIDTNSQKPFYIYKTNEFSYQDLMHRIIDVQSFIISKKVDCVILNFINGFDYIASFIACIFSKVPVIPFNKRIIDSQKDIISSQFQKVLTLSDESLKVVRKTRKSTIDISSKISKNNICYIMFTSGTSGKNKLVKITYDGFYCFIIDILKSYRLDKTDIVYQFSSYSFDAHLEEIFPTIFAGGTLVAKSNSNMLDFDSILHDLTNYKVSILNFPTAIFNEFVSFVSNQKPECNLAVKKVIVGGEKLEIDKVNLFYKLNDLNRRRLFNTYGLTETTIVNTCIEITKSLLDNVDEIPIGKPLDSSKIKIVNESKYEGRLVGEIAIGGICLADNITQLGNIVEIDNNKYYLTGDLGYVSEDNNLFFLRRKDSQIKVLGVRFNIESLLEIFKSLTDIKDCGYIKLKNGYFIYYQNIKEIDLSMLNEHLCAIFPKEALPLGLLKIKDIPFNENGKTDKNRLKYIFLNRFKKRDLNESVLTSFLEENNFLDSHKKLNIKSIDLLQIQRYIELEYGLMVQIHKLINCTTLQDIIELVKER